MCHSRNLFHGYVIFKIGTDIFFYLANHLRALGRLSGTVLACDVFRTFGHPAAHSVNGQDRYFVETVYLMIIIELMSPHLLLFHIRKEQLQHILLENTEILFAQMALSCQRDKKFFHLPHQALRFLRIKQLSPGLRKHNLPFFSPALFAHTDNAVLLQHVILAVGEKAAVSICDLFTEDRFAKIAQKLCLKLTAAPVCQDAAPFLSRIKLLLIQKNHYPRIDNDHLTAVAFFFDKGPRQVLYCRLTQILPPGAAHFILIGKGNQHHPVSAVLVQVRVHFLCRRLNLLRPAWNPV